MREVMQARERRCSSISSTHFSGRSRASSNVKSSRARGPRTRHGRPSGATRLRIDATNFALANDDGAVTRGLRARRRHTGRRVALGQDADLHLHGDAVRDLRGELSVDRRRFRGQAAAGAAAQLRRRSCSVSPSRRHGCSRSATSAGRAAAMPPCRSANTKCAPRRACSSGSAYHIRIRPSARSRKSRAVSSTARGSNAGCGRDPGCRGVPRFTVARNRCAIVDA